MTSSTQLNFVTLDVFTATKYEGNPLAVVMVPASTHLTQDQKLAIAREFNLSETTFLHERKPGETGNAWMVDIFLTTGEIPFAGHPTIGTACHVLSAIANAEGSESRVIHAEFEVKAGTIQLEYHASDNTTKAAIPHDLHIHRASWNHTALLQFQPRLAAAFQSMQLPPRDQYPVVSIVKGMTFVLVELDNETLLNSVSTTAQSLNIDGLDKEWSNRSFVGTYFYVRLPDSHDGTKRLRTRMIEGTLEDPATGSAASDLAGYLALQEGESGATMKFAITQGVEMGRRSEISIEVAITGDGTIDSIYLIGSAVQVMEGRLVV